MTTKKFQIFYIVAIACAVLGTSCKKDFLERNPSTSLPSDQAIQSVADLQNAANGIYSQLIDFSYYGGDFTIYADLKGSDFRSMDSYNQISPIGRYEHDKYSSFPQNYYATIYVTLARINDVLAASEQLKGTEAEQKTINDLKGQLYALRGLLHFDAARLFAQLPTVAADANKPNSGVVLAKEKFAVDYKPARATLKETYDFIISDFTQSLSLLEKAKKTGYINYWAALALRSKVYLYLNKNNEALADAAAVITNSPYKLYTTSNYTSVWDKEGTDEALFEALTNEQYNAQRNSIGYYTHAEGYAEAAATSEFVAFVKSNPNDVRGELLQEEDDNGENKAFYPQKYPGRSGNLYLNNPKVIRLAEVYLIAAEAAVKGGTAAGAKSAAGYINDLRENRIVGYIPVLTVSLDDILNERRKELFVEGNMAWDYWRNGKTVNNPTKGQISGNDELAILPIPYRETQISSNLAQNAGY